MVESDQYEDERIFLKKFQNNTILNEVHNKCPRHELFDINLQYKKTCMKNVIIDEEKPDLSQSYSNSVDNGINKTNDNMNIVNKVKNDLEMKETELEVLENYGQININTNILSAVINKGNNLIKKKKNDNENMNYNTIDRKLIEKYTEGEIKIECTENIIKKMQNKNKEDKIIIKATKENLNDYVNELENETLKKSFNNSNTEIINGIELIVECASDEEISEVSEREENSKSRSKTIIIREKPNASEVDVSLSETEKSDSYNIIEAKSKVNTDFSKGTVENKIKKRNRKKSALYKAIVSESENSIKSNSDDEDYSPITRKRIKKFSPKKYIKATETKRGRGRPRGRPPKIRKILNELLDHKKEQIKESFKLNIDPKFDEKADKNLVQVTISNNTDESKNESSGKEIINEYYNIKNVKTKKSSQFKNKMIDKLKKLIRTAGIKVHCYQALLNDYKTDTSKIKYLYKLLEEHGMVGRPTLEKCKKLRIKNYTKKEIEELDSKIIFSETCSTRGNNTRNFLIESEVSASPNKKCCSSFKRIKAIIDSDSE